MLDASRWQPARLTAAVLTGAAVTFTLVAGCGTVHAGQPGTGLKVASQAQPARAGRQVPPAGSARQARLLADELLSRLVVPAGAHPIAWHPPPALRQTQIALGVPHQADARELRLAPGPMPALISFIQAHPPAGLVFLGTGQAGSASGITSETATFVLRSLPPAIQQAQLVVEIAPAGKDTSILRADAQVIWYPPRSAAEFVAPARWHAVTVTASFLAPVWHVVRRTFTAPAVIAALARFLNGLPAAPGGITPCPMINVSYTLAFTPAVAARPSLVASTSYCDTVQITAGGRAQPALADRNGLIRRAAQAALAGHPGSLAPAPGPTTPVPAPATSPPLPAGP